MQHIKTENNWSLNIDSKPIDKELYMLRLITQFDLAKNPDEFREICKLFLKKDEIEKIISELKNLIKL